MERIQSALEKAREARGEIPQETPVRGEGETQGHAASSAADRWLELEEATINPRILRRNRVMAYEGGVEAGPFDMLRTKVLQQMRANNWRRLVITSPTSGCGKTTTSCNLAFSLARQPDVRTMVIEIDMRRPAMARTLGQKKLQHQFGKVLSGTAAMRDHVIRYGNNLCFGTNHAPMHNSAELLQSQTTVEALAEIEKTLEPTIMIFDTSPLLVSDDTIGFLGQVDCALLVAEAESTTIDEIDTCEKDLAAHTNVLGVVLNKCRYMGKGYGYGYGYGY